MASAIFIFDFRGNANATLFDAQVFTLNDGLQLLVCTQSGLLLPIEHHQLGRS